MLEYHFACLHDLYVYLLLQCDDLCVKCNESIEKARLDLTGPHRITSPSAAGSLRKFKTSHLRLIYPEESLISPQGCYEAEV